MKLSSPIHNFITNVKRDEWQGRWGRKCSKPKCKRVASLATAWREGRKVCWWWKIIAKVIPNPTSKRRENVGYRCPISGTSRAGFFKQDAHDQLILPDDLYFLANNTLSHFSKRLSEKLNWAHSAYWISVVTNWNYHWIVLKCVKMYHWPKSKVRP